MTAPTGNTAPLDHVLPDDPSDWTALDHAVATANLRGAIIAGMREELAVSEGHRELLKAFARAFQDAHDTRLGSDLMRWNLPIDRLWEAWRDIAFTDLEPSGDLDGAGEGDNG